MIPLLIFDTFCIAAVVSWTRFCLANTWPLARLFPRIFWCWRWHCCCDVWTTARLKPGKVLVLFRNVIRNDGIASLSLATRKPLWSPGALTMFPLLTSNCQLCYMMMRTLKISQYHQKEPTVNVFFQGFFSTFLLLSFLPSQKSQFIFLVTIVSSRFRDTHAQGISGNSFMKLAQMVLFFALPTNDMSKRTDQFKNEWTLEPTQRGHYQWQHLQHNRDWHSFPCGCFQQPLAFRWPCSSALILRCTDSGLLLY